MDLHVSYTPVLNIFIFRDLTSHLKIVTLVYMRKLVFIDRIKIQLKNNIKIICRCVRTIKLLRGVSRSINTLDTSFTLTININLIEVHHLLLAILTPQQFLILPLPLKIIIQVLMTIGKSLTPAYRKICCLPFRVL